MISKTIDGFWKRGDRNLPTIVFIILLSIFAAYSVFLACNLQKYIIPDETAHFAFSEHYAKTWTIPEDTSDTYIYGWYIEQNPFLYYWISGRALNALNLVAPGASEWQKLLFLRLLNVVFATGTVVFCYLISKEIIRDKWWQLLPIFLLTNTLMFVFLSAGVNYDNLANLFSFAGLFFFVRVLKGKEYLSNSLGWILLICLATLVKYPILPLALGMAIAWTIYTLQKRTIIFPINVYGRKYLFLGLVTALAIYGNLALYGVNLLTYHALLPDCTDLLGSAECEQSPYVTRYQETALDHKLTVSESIQRGYPDPLEYVVYSWIPTMLDRVYGVTGHKIYSPSHIITLYYLWLIWGLCLIFRYWKRPSFTTYTLLGIFLFYSLVLFIDNYNSELVFGFRHYGFQGRYIFPVIGIAYTLVGSLFSKIQNRILRFSTLIVTIGLFFYGGPIKILVLYDTFFRGWLIR